MSSKTVEFVPPPRVARAAEKAGLGHFQHRHDRRTPAWRMYAEVTLLVSPLILLLASRTGGPESAWNWLGVPAMGIGIWRLSPILGSDDGVPTKAPARDIGKLALYAGLLGGYLAWQWHLDRPGDSFDGWLTVVAVTAAVPVLVIGFDVLFLAYAPWYTYSGGLLIGNSWGGRRRVVRYADVRTLRYESWSQTWLERHHINLGSHPYPGYVSRSWHRLRVRRGRSLRFTSSEAGSEVDNLSPQICAGVAEAQVAAVLTKIQDGGKVRFGRITADRDHVRAGSVSVRWEKVSSIEYRDRKLVIHTTEGSPDLTFRARRIPNGETLRELHQELRGQRKPVRRKRGKRR